MSRIKERIFGVVIAIGLILAVTIMLPVAAGATQIDPFGDGSVVLDVSVTGDGVSYTYNYEIQNPGAPLMQVSIANRETTDLELHTVLTFSADFPSDSSKTVATKTSFKLFFAGGYLPQDSIYDFSITYAGFLDDQNIIFTKYGDADMVTATNRYSPLPEPATVMLLGMGVLGAAFFYRRRRGANK